MERICGVSWHGAKKKKQIEVGGDVDNFFSKEQLEIILLIDNNKYYSKLPPSFFTVCRHLRTAYDDQTCKGTNRLHEWVVNNNVERAKLEVITKYKEFRLSKYELNAFNI
jgi:hypothetical protein